MTSTVQRRRAICAALGTVACSGLIVLWANARGPATRLVQSDRSDNAVRAFAAPEPSLTRSSPATSRVDSDLPADERGTGNRDALAALVVALADAETNVRMDAVSDLGLFSDPQAESLLALTAMQDPAPLVRTEALYALETLRAESQLEAFERALHDPDRDVRAAAISVLEALESEPPDDAE